MTLPTRGTSEQEFSLPHPTPPHPAPTSLPRWHFALAQHAPPPARRALVKALETFLIAVHEASPWGFRSFRDRLHTIDLLNNAGRQEESLELWAELETTQHAALKTGTAAPGRSTSWDTAGTPSGKQPASYCNA